MDPLLQKRIDAANAALEAVDLAAPEAKGVVLELADALNAAAMYAEVVGLAGACRDRFPGFAELQARGDAAEQALAEQQRASRAAARKAKPITIVACIPGREFSGAFFDAWHEFAEKCREVGVNLVLSRKYDAVVYYARNRVAGGDVRRGAKQAPWGGEIDYDYMLWIDSDVVFRFEDFQALLAHKVDMVAGLYLMADGQRFAAVQHMDEAAFKHRGEFEFLTPAATSKHEGLMKVDYCGFGFVLVRKGVFEKLEYPWFRPLYVEIGECTDFTSEDVGFCMMAKRAGISMLVDPKVVVGHEKAVVLTPKRAA